MGNCSWPDGSASTAVAGVHGMQPRQHHALGLVLFVVTLVLNVVALRIVRAYQEQYE